jgi:hypothetical protein
MKVRLTLIHETEFSESDLPFLLKAVEDGDDQYINESFGVMWDTPEEIKIELIRKKNENSASRIQGID